MSHLLVIEINVRDDRDDESIRTSDLELDAAIARKIELDPRVWSVKRLDGMPVLPVQAAFSLADRPNEGPGW